MIFKLAFCAIQVILVPLGADILDNFTLSETCRRRFPEDRRRTAFVPPEIRERDGGEPGSALPHVNNWGGTLKRVIISLVNQVVL